VTRAGLVFVVLVLASCSCGGANERDVDAATDDAGTSDALVAIDTATDTAADVGTAARCTSPSTASWSLADAAWSTDFAPRGVSGGVLSDFRILDLTAHDGEVFLAGSFEHAGPVLAHNVASWSASRGFRALGDGLDADYAWPIVVRPDGTLVAGTGRYDGAGRHGALHGFAGGTWTLISDAGAGISALELDVDGSVIVAGEFTTLAGIATNGLARWDGAHVTAIDAPRGGTSAVLADAAGLCLGGHDAVGGYVMCRGAGETSWVDQALPDPVHAIVLTLARDATGALLVAGDVDTAPGSRIGGVLRLEGGTWVPLGGGLTSGGSSAEVRALVVGGDGSIVAVGNFERAVLDTAELLYVARWTGARWEPVGATFPLAAMARNAAASGTDLFVAGDFVEAYGDHAVSAFGIARWDGASWHGLDTPGAATLGNARVSRVAVDPACTMYVGGTMRAAGDFSSDYSAVRHADAWSPLTGLPGEPTVLTTAADGTVYAAGLTPGLIVASTPYFVRLHGSMWEPVPGANGVVEAVAFGPDGTTYVAMDYVVHVLQGDTLTPVGDREPTPIRAMLVASSGLLVATPNAVERWDGASWTLVSEVSFIPSSLIEWNGHVVIGGRGGLGFVHDDRIEAVLFPDVASANIVAMAGVGQQLIVAGNRESGGAPPALAAWSDEHGTWDELDFDGRAVDDVTVADGALLFAGDFTTVDGVASTGIARLEAR
jgi:hypothetical protein